MGRQLVRGIQGACAASAMVVALGACGGGGASPHKTPATVAGGTASSSSSPGTSTSAGTASSGPAATTTTTTVTQSAAASSSSEASSPANANIPSGAAPGAGGPVPSNATPLTETYSDQYSSMPAFKTPSGNNGCQVDPGWARCGSTQSGEIFLSSDGQIMSPAPADDAPMWSQADTLAYGEVRYSGNTVFAVTKQGVTVWNTQTGHGALINTSGVQQF